MKVEKIEKLKIIYEIIMAVLSLTVILLLIIELLYNLSPSLFNIFDTIDNTILVIFIVDYFTRLSFAKNKKEFFKNSIIDLISIIPFSSAFQAAKLLRLSRLIRLTKITKFVKIIKAFRSITLLLKFRNHIDRFLKTNNFNYVIMITLFTLLLGTIGIHITEGTSMGNALWWSFVTITTVGYGDISPVTPLGRILAGFLMLIGIGFLSMLTGTIATFFLSKNNSASYKCEAIENIKTKLDSFDKMSIDDVNNICEVLKALKKNSYQELFSKNKKTVTY